ncbi:MAG: hypothetical protein K8W52_04315 [Deltaproteobacteria bacterium]|nr:hypothetical protein [Deltaproteobacteria bacterium]
MKIANVSTGSQPTGMPSVPTSVSKDDLTSMRDHLKQGGQDTGSIDKLIATFDKAAGSNGKMSMTQFKSFASDNGVTLPDPSKGPPGNSGGARRAGPPPSGGMPPAGAHGGRGGPGAATAAPATSGASSGSSKDVTIESDSDLEKAANQGDQKALAELKRRETERARTHEQSVLDSVDASLLGAKSGSVE